MTALMIGTALAGTGMPGAARAQDAVVVTLGGQTLAVAVVDFGRSTGWQVAYPSELRGLRTNAVRGTMPPAEALQRMLAGTGVEIRRTGPASVALVRVAGPGGTVTGAVVLSPVVLTGGETGTGPVNGIIATRSASGTRTDTPLIETPQTVNVVGREQMEQQGAATVSQALRYTPGVVTGTAGAQAGRFDSYFVRGSGGFSADASYASTLDGLRWRFPDRTAVQFDPWMIERVEVVKGPASTLFGAGSPGGLVNLISKRPSFQKRSEVFAGVGSHSSYEAGFDFTGPLSDTVAYRFIGLGRGGDTGIDFQRDERIMFAPSITWAPTDRTSVTLQALYQRDPQSPDTQFVPPYGSVLAIPGYGTVSPSFWQGDPNWQEYSRTQKSLGFIVDHAFNDAWSVHSSFRYGELESTTKSLDFSWMSDATTMNRLIYLAEHKAYSTAFDTYVQGRFATGEVDHTLVAGVDYQKLSGGFSDGWDRGNYPAIDIFNPVYGIAITPPETFRIFRQPFEQTGLYLQDQLAFGNWRILGSLRRDKIETGSSVTNTLNGMVTESSSDDSKTTWRLGGVYLFDNGYAPFLNYATSFEPELGLDASGDVLKPSEGKMLEGGVRYLSADGKMAWSATLFSGSKEGQPVADSVRTAQCAANVGPTSTCYTQDNKSEARGLELEARAELVSGLDVIAGLTLQKVRLTESSDATINPNIVNGDRSVDKRLVAVPDRVASLWLNYRVPAAQALTGWTFGGGVRHIGPTYGTTTNVWGATEGPYDGQASRLSSFTLFDAAVSYDFGAADPALRGLTGNLRVSNLFDRDYVAACNGYGTCSFGEERVVKLTVNYTW